MKKFIFLPVILLLLSEVYFSQNTFTITGKVVDEERSAPFNGVTVSVKGNACVNTTDKTGKFKVQVPAGKILLFSYVGYLSKEYIITASRALNVTYAMRSSSILRFVTTLK